MGQPTVADTIREITRKHLQENNGLLLGQCITAVGWVNNTVPNCQGIVEFPMTDVAGASIAVGVAQVGRRPILVIRFQNFLILNANPLISYAATIKEIHGISAPIFVRAIASEGLGLAHSGVLHSIFMHFPGFRVCSPMTPGEYQTIWDVFMESDDPMIVSEHRLSYPNTQEMHNVRVKGADITIYAISCTRFEMDRVVQLLGEKGIKCNVVHILWLKPFEMTDEIIEPLKESKLGLVVDPGYEIAGASQSIAYTLNQITGHQIKALGLLDKAKCLCPPLQNRFPDANRICEVVEGMLH